MKCERLLNTDIEVEKRREAKTFAGSQRQRDKSTKAVLQIKYLVTNLNFLIIMHAFYTLKKLYKQKVLL